MTEIKPDSALHYPWLWLSLGLLMLLAVIVFSLIAIDQRMISFTHLDKVEHLLAWGFLMFWFTSIYPQRGLVLFAILLTVSLGVELLQTLTTWRQGSGGDFLANFIGLLIGGAIARVSNGRLLQSIDQWLYQRISRA
ncbi:MAG: hypothetical protein L3J24_12090 [Xanthomonadales bacterium]|nr:hypothetical protein [Xanthomonadales bacterium]